MRSDFDWIDIQKDTAHIAKEKKKAAELKKSAWWKNEIQKGICHYCKQKFPSFELTVDHIVPLSRGGKTSKGNVAPCCKDCNNKKKYLTPAEIILHELEEKTKL